MSRTPAAADGPERGGPAGSGSFGQVLHAEWTKFRTVLATVLLRRRDA